MNPFKSLFAFAVLAFLLGCEDPQPTATCVDGVQNGNEDGVDCGGDCPPCLSTFTIAGNVQKGPFLNGSSVLASALDSNLTPLGGTFNTQILQFRLFRLQQSSTTLQFYQSSCRRFLFQ